MGAVEHARDFLATLKPGKGQTVEGFAEQLFNWQMEVYSSYAGSDLGGSFYTLDKKIQEGWFKAARAHPHALKEWKMTSTTHDRLQAALAAKGWAVVPYQSRKYTVMRRGADKDRFYLGKAGALRYSAQGTIATSHPQERTKAALLKEVA